jgi:hypothetical protein
MNDMVLRAFIISVFFESGSFNNEKAW